jgi:protein phosphatase
MFNVCAYVVDLILVVISIAKTIFDVDGVSVEPEYSGVKLPWPLTYDSVLKMLESFKEGKELHYVYVNRIFEAIKNFHSPLSGVQEISIPEEKRITVIGDLHGQLQDLFTILTINGLPSEDNMYLFNGDIVDRGNNGAECLLVIFAFKLVLPERVFINRGNHESRAQNSWMGFEEEILEKYDGSAFSDPGRGRRLFELVSDAFDTLPLASIIEKKVFVVHGGLARDHGITVDHIRSIKRKREPPIDKPGLENRLYEDLLWSDPRPTANYPEPLKGYKVSDRGAGIEFGPDVTNGFCMTNSVALVIRSHECVQEGYEVLHGGRLITIFSASRYCGTQTNKGAFITFDKTMQPEIQQFFAHHIASNTFVKPPTEEERLSALENDTVVMIVERICDHKPDLYYYFTTIDAAKTGTVSKVQWANALKTVLSLDIPFLSYAHRLVEAEADGNINYAKFIERFRIEMRPEDMEWQIKIVENVCEKLFEVCGNIEQAFEIFDANSDGTIEYEEFSKTLKKLDLGLSDLQIFELMRDIDVNKDSQIELNEFLERFQVSFTMVKEKHDKSDTYEERIRRRHSSFNMNPDEEPDWDDWTRDALGKIGLAIYGQKLSLPQAFAKFDESESGWISYEEFAKALVIFDSTFSNAEALKLAKAVDGNNSGRINYMEFVSAFKVADKGPKRRTSIKDGPDAATSSNSNWQMAVIQQVSNVLYQHRIQLRSAFRMFDTDNDGKVTAEEFQSGLKAINALLDNPLSEMQVDQLMKSLDRNGDGSLDYKEFLEGFQIVDASAPANIPEGVSKRRTSLQ